MNCISYYFDYIQKIYSKRKEQFKTKIKGVKGKSIKLKKQESEVEKSA